MKKFSIAFLLTLCFLCVSFLSFTEAEPVKSDWILVQDYDEGTFDLIDDGVRGCLIVIGVEGDGSFTTEFVGDC